MKLIEACEKEGRVTIFQEKLRDLEFVDKEANFKLQNKSGITLL